MRRLWLNTVTAIALSACNQQPAKKSESAPVMQTAERHGGGLRKACASELQKYCSGDERGRARRECLESHMSELSDTCKGTIQARGERRHGGRRRGL